MGMATTVKIDKATQKILKELAEKQGVSMQAVLHEAIEKYRRECFFKELSIAVERLKSDPKAWQEELDERKLWDNTLRDGLGNEHPPKRVNNA